MQMAHRFHAFAAVVVVCSATYVPVQGVRKDERFNERSLDMSFFGEVRRATRTGLDRMISARERQVRRYVNASLLHLDDQTLASAGFDRKEIEKQGAVLYPL